MLHYNGDAGGEHHHHRGGGEEEVFADFVAESDLRRGDAPDIVNHQSHRTEEFEGTPQQTDQRQGAGNAGLDIQALGGDKAADVNMHRQQGFGDVG